MSDDDRAHCCFCFSVLDRSPDGEGLKITVTRAGSRAQQEFWAHPACIAHSLHSGVPFESEIFFDDELADDAD